MYNGGLGDSICQLLSRNMPLPVEMVGVNDTFGESGTPDQLMAKYGLDVKDVVAAAERAIARKN
jgi:transketolase